MGLIVYACDDAFPERIQAVLQANGYTVDPLPDTLGKIAHFPKAFAFSVTKGRAAVHVVGCEDPRPPLCFFISTPLARNPLSWRASSRLYRNVESILLDNGARELAEEELRARPSDQGDA